jgi:hypothetical protein
MRTLKDVLFGRRTTIYWCFFLKEHPRRTGGAQNLIFTVFYPHIQLYLKGLTTMILTDTQQVVLHIAAVDKRGNSARLDGAPVWVSSDPTLLTITAEADGMSATGVAVGPLGKLTVSVTADADLGEGVRELTGVLDVEVVGAEAGSFAITADKPTEQA